MRSTDGETVRRLVRHPVIYTDMVQMPRAPAALERILTCIVASSYQFRRFVYMLINLVSRYNLANRQRRPVYDLLTFQLYVIHCLSPSILMSVRLKAAQCQIFSSIFCIRLYCYCTRQLNNSSNLRYRLNSVDLIFRVFSFRLSRQDELSGCFSDFSYLSVKFWFSLYLINFLF